ncbi:AAA family ATPase [Neiella sp. HB171785]|uniref:AAA family ATPase n=1 Tax=Neiella litorisoli TaxID=2771431 RepID=A0A8J6QEY0_9GAMM|nr:AAA family ATPase [Neiella litorisoli]MBD1387935.1 AAA family ATPase [Neiella litorisoli]
MELEPQATSLLPSQQQLMLRIQHLAGLDSNLVIIAGREGAGKHTLASALVEQYSAEYDLAWLEVSSKSSDSVVRAQLLNQLFADTAYDPDEPLQHSVNQILGDTGGKQMIVLTHADRLSNQLLVELWSLVENSRKLPAGTHHISVLMFAEPMWANRVSREMAAITEADQPVLQIPSLPLEERKQLFSLLQQRLGHSELDTDLVERQLDEQDGLPGEVVALCQDAGPITDDTDDAAEEDKQRQAIPKIWLIAAAVGLTLLLLILWWATSGQQPTNEPSESAAVVEQISEAVASVEPQADETAHDLSQPAVADEPLESLPEQLPETTVTTQVADESDKQRIEVDEQTISSIEAADSSKDSAATAPQEVEPAAVEAAVIETATTPLAAEPEIEPQAAPEPTPQVATGNTNAAVEPSPWWQQLDSNRYVLQLGVMSSQSRFDTFARRYGLSDDPLFRHYQSERNGKRVFIGVYGDYPSSAAARQALNSMSAQVQALKPWPKTVATIQQEAVAP